jgi:hypothetical protein
MGTSICCMSLQDALFSTLYLKRLSRSLQSAPSSSVSGYNRHYTDQLIPRPVQGYSSFAPFDVVDFVSLYIQLPFLLLMFTLRKLIWRPPFMKLDEVDLVTDEYQDTLEDEEDDKQRVEHLKGRWHIFWRLYYLLA